MYIDRFLEGEIFRYLGKREIIAVTGPRQSGKTTLLKHIFAGLKEAHFLDFEDRETLELFNGDIKSFVELHVKPYKYLFIDEFQYSKEGGKNLKFIYDNHETKILVSGSSASGLSIHGIKYLVGRILVFNLYPFSFEEFLNFREPELFGKIYVKGRLSEPVIGKIIPLFNEFCVYGGYPRVVLSKNSEEKELVLRNIYNTYFLKEIKEILNIPEDFKLSKLIHALALQTGGILNYNELSGITSLNYKDLLKNLNILEKTFICQRSQPFYSNKRTELVKAPKIFFYDNGFRNAVIKNFQPAKDRADKGALYENFAATELVKKQFELKYWRAKSKAEVDFVLEKNGKIIPIEIKSSLNKPIASKSFQSFTEKYKPKKALILSEKLNAEKNNIKFRPIFYISQEI
ncbi:MAG: ATP-binding protein [Candidatus Diapherotrites archaeon]